MNARGLIRLLGRALMGDAQTVPGSSSNTHKLIPEDDDTVFHLGNGTNSWDVHLFGASASNHLVWDASASTLTATSATIALPGSSSLTVGGNSVYGSASLATGAAAGITGGTGTVYYSNVRRLGTIYHTQIWIDLTGLGSSTTDLDIIGQGASAAYIAKLTAAECGTTIFALQMTCLEAPATGVADIDLYSATEATGVFDAGIATLAETALITAGGAWTNGAVKGATTVPLSTEYLYLTGGAGGTANTYTAGKFLIELWGY